MTHAARYAGAATAALLLLPVSASAQFEPTVREALHGCAVLDSVPRRLECIDSVLARADGDRADSARAGANGARGRAGNDAGAPSRAEAAASPSSEGPAEAPPRSESSNAAEAPRAAGAAASRGASRAVETAAPRSPADADGERTVLVVEVDTRIPGRAVFITEAGEQFVQTSGDSRLLLPTVPFQAELRPGAVGSQFLSPLGQGRTVRVSQRD